MKQCENCGNVFLPKEEVNKVNHLLHFFLSILTCSLWIFVWCGISINSIYKCEKCNKTTTFTNFFPVIFIGLWVLIIALYIIS